ncbi:MAG TPA: GNAT family N-acetyltransferase [Desulfuromonadales bacterium]|nr:GNAT family N-acetyltransferase [Desulfuromonadales bacterium]
MPEFTLRSLYPEDIQQVSDIESSLAGSPRMFFLEKRLAAASAIPENFITCAVTENRKLAGYGFARVLEGEFGSKSAIAVLDTVGVAPEYQGRGIGNMILSGIERRMKNRDITVIQTQTVWSRYAMIRFFAATGFSMATGQIIERDTSPLNGDVAPVAPGIVVRALKGTDISAINKIDTKLTGLDRSAYFASKFREMLDDSGVRVSMVAEHEGIISGYIMARVDYGEFGQVEKAAVIDTIGVHPDYAGTGVGHELLSQLLVNLATLQVEVVRTKVEHENSGLRNFLAKRGFKPSQRLILTKEIH